MPSFDRIEGFLFVFVRCLGFFGIGPLLSDRKVPATIKALAALATAFALYPVYEGRGLPVEGTLFGFLLLLGREVLLGAALGLAASFVFHGVRMAGSLLGIQMGFSIVNVFDPSSGGETSLVGEMQQMLAVLLFLLADGHHLLLRALAFSLEKVPPGGALQVSTLAAALVPMGATMFTTMIQVGAPILGALFLTDAALGFVARAVPQMNVFIVGIPVKIGVGIVLLVVTAPLFARLLEWHFGRMEGQLLTLLGGM
jgi:flagellar biosynthetic protein FliR